MTNNREDYLKVIFKLNESGNKVNNKLIAQHLNVAPASVSEMLKKLSKEGLIIIHNYNIDLTDKAIAITKDILSKHRLWETFLLTKMNYKWQDVHEQAEKLEHVTDESLKNKLNEFLNFPKYCPHGSIIYENQESEVDEIISMDLLKVKEKARIIRVHSDRELLSYLDRLGLNINSEFRVIERDLFDNSMKIEFMNKEIVVSFKALSAIYVIKI